MQVAIGPLLAALLVISFLQINGRDVEVENIAKQHHLKQTLLLLLCTQLVLPIVLLLLMRSFGVPVDWQIPVTMVAAASFITGGPSIVMMLGGDGKVAIRLLIASTLALPLTALPVLAMLPLHSSHTMLIRTSVVLTLVVIGAYFVAKLIRRYLLAAWNTNQRHCLDGLSAILLALIVLGLMAAIHSTWDNPGLLVKTLFWACVVNFGFQILGLCINHLFSLNLPIVLGVMTGNRAVAIFLTALPASSYHPYLLFIACYQIPMYLTPLLGSFVYRRYSNHAA